LGKDSGSRKRSQGKPDATWTSGNIFKDIDVPNADEVLFKVDLAIAIGDVLRRRRLTQRSAAEIARIDQPKISALLSGDIRGFSADRLIKILTRLGQDVEIRVRISKSGKGRARVAA
jgi:predicted XRE-type DNA-binding protein